MTPDLAGFIAEGDDPQTWDEITPAVLAALTAEFDVLPERAGAGAAASARPGSTPSTGGCTRRD